MRKIKKNVKKINRFLHFKQIAYIGLSVFISSIIFLGIIKYGIAEQSGSSPESGTTSRIKTISEDLSAKGFGSTSAGTWGNWGATWNRIYSSAVWVPSDATATVSDVASGKTFYAGSNRVKQTGGAAIVTPPANVTPAIGDASRLNTLYKAVKTVSYGAETVGTWGDWGTMWNRIYSASTWTPSDATANIGDVTNGKTFYSGNNRTILTGRLGALVFGTKVDYTTGGADERVVALGDLNGDGIKDIVIDSYTTHKISVFMNSGTGTFPTKVEYLSNVGLNGVGLADLNNDGKLDMVGVNYDSSNMSVFINNGNGTFAAKVDYATGSHPNKLTIADLTGDGYADIVEANNGNANITVFKNNGNGTFASFGSYATGTNPHSIAIGDFNADGLIDIVVGNYGSGTISVYKNNGGGSFAGKVDYSAGSNPLGGITTADFNADGKLDVAIPAYGADKIAVFVNNGSGSTISFATKVDLSTGSYPDAVASADLNADGKKDIVAANSSGNSVSLFANNGIGTNLSFASKSDYSTGAGPSTVALGDLNGDGKPDLVVGYGGASTVSVFMNIW